MGFSQVGNIQHKSKSILLVRMFSIGLLASIGGLFLALASPGQSYAADNQVEVLIGDVCPNIPGLQLTVPNGMVTDGGGNCVTPAPPPLPDACPNIDGYQTAIPDGYYRNQAGNCVRQTNPPKDVCPNLSGTQTSVPLGMNTAGNGECTWPPNDSCVNIPGPQDTMPEGMKYDAEGACVTPTVTPPPKDPSSPNIPEVLEPIATPLINIIPDWLKNIIKGTSPTFARTLPYYLIGMLTVIALLFLWQTILEALTTRNIFLAFRRKKRLAEEKDSFIALSTQYLRITTASMLVNIDNMKSEGSAASETYLPLADTTKKLQSNIEALVAESEQNKAVEDTNALDRARIRVKTLVSPLFWIPIVMTMLAILIANVLFGVVGGIELGKNNLWMQLMAFIAACLLLYAAVRSRHIRHIRHQNAEKLIADQSTIDSVRNAFIEQSRAILQSGLREIEAYRDTITDTPSGALFQGDYQSLSRILAIFTILDNIQSGAGDRSKLNVRDVIDNCLLERQDALDDKKMTITDSAEPHELHQNRRLLSFVLGSAIDYAIRFSKSGGNISIDTSSAKHGLEIQVGNNAPGIPKEKLETLSSPTNPVTIDSLSGYEELGLSLFLDKIIMNYLGGDIAIDSSPKGALITIVV